MKCLGCNAAEPVIKYQGTVPYWHKGHTTTVSDVNGYVCLRCGYEFIPSGHAQRWLIQTALFRAKIDSMEPENNRRPESLKDKIVVEWLSLDPDRLAADVFLEEGTYLRWKTLAAYSEKHRNMAFEAFAACKGSYATTRPGCADVRDWMTFLDALRQARVIAAKSGWEAPGDGVVYGPRV
jgi:YgiT-type zinc finger domain-containing protein